MGLDGIHLLFAWSSLLCGEGPVSISLVGQEGSHAVVLDGGLCGPGSTARSLKAGAENWAWLGVLLGEFSPLSSLDKICRTIQPRIKVQ